MADISVIKLPNGSSYNIKDSQAVSTGSFSGHELTLTKRGGGIQTIDLGEFDSLDVTDANVGNLIVTGAGRFTNGLYGNLIGNAQSATTTSNVTATAGTSNADRHVWFSDVITETQRAYDDDFKYNPSTNTLTVANISGNATSATTATKATQDESGNNIKASYAASFSISNHTITLKNKNGESLGTVTVPDNNTWTAMVGATSSADGSVGYVNAVPPKANYNTAYLRADGTWAVPPNTHNTAYLYAGASNGTANAATTNGNTYLILKDGSSVSSRVKLTPSTNMNITSDASGNVIFTATDTTYSAGVGLTLSSTTFKAKLKSETSASIDSAAVTTTTNRQYAVHPDKSGYLSVNIPWTDTTYSVVTAGTSTTDGGLMSQSDKTKLNGIATGAEVNQNAFSNFTVGNTTIAADSKTDTLTLVAGSNVTLTPDAINDKVTIAAVDTMPSAYCTTAAGTAAKVASCTNFTLRTNTYIQVIMVNSNSSQSQLTLNINNTGAKNIYINGTLASSSNYTLPAGSYFVYYDGTYYYFNTNGSIPGTIDGSNKVLLSKSSSKKYLIGSNARTGQQLLWTSNNEIYMEEDTLYSPNISATTAISGVNISASGYLAANSGNSGSAGGLALWGTSPSAYGIAMRQTNTTSGGTYGFVTGDWAIYSYMTGGANRGWIWKNTSTGMCASLDSNGKAVFNNSVTAKEKLLITNTSDYSEVELGYENTLYHNYGKLVLRDVTYEEDSDTGELSGISGTDIIKLDANTGIISKKDIATVSDTQDSLSLSLKIGLNSVQTINQGLYSTGYIDSNNSFVSSPKWIIYRDKDGNNCIGGTINAVEGNVWALKASNEVNNGVYHSGNGIRTYLAITNAGNHGLYSGGYYNGSTYTADGRWLIYRDVNNVTVLDGDVYFTDNIAGQKNIRAYGASDVHIYSENTTSKCYSSCRSLNNGEHGLYSNGYYNGSAYTAGGKWLVYRNQQGRTHIMSAHGAYGMPVISDGTANKQVSLLTCYSGTQLGIYGNWATSSWSYRFVAVTTSDPRLKDNIEPSKMRALDLLNKINLYSFDWKDGTTPHYDVGYIATELYELDHNLAIKPEDESEGYWGVNDFYMSGLQTKAIQELSAENEELRNKITSLETRISLLETLIK